ncbi:DUF4139 domain-containing protein, partial [candidate division KSB1 bacterium]|nr:DUF4139 domain-containing protein [candidate division KSB1 bacterium]
MKKIAVFIFIFWGLTLVASEKDVAITVYNNNLALVKDNREINLDKGKIEIKFQEVAAAIDPTSVHFASLTAPDAVAILEQNYEYDLVSSEKILEKYIDQEITVYTKDQSFQGTLLSSAGGTVVLQLKTGNIKIISTSAIINLDFPKLPQGLMTKPTLVWLLDVTKAGAHKTEVSYLTSDINWHAEYVAVTKKDDSLLELNSWVSIDNRSGADYEEAKLKLVAGEVHIAEEQRVRPMAKDFAVMAERAAAPQFEEKEFFEYHLYTLQNRTTIKNNQIKQISLFPTAEVNLIKVYVYNGAQYGDNVRVNLEFKNSKTAGLGLPLPKGKVRVYKEDEADNSLEFVGEDFINHTPKDEKVRIYLGNAFDIKGERIQKDTKR